MTRACKKDPAQISPFLPLTPLIPWVPCFVLVGTWGTWTRGRCRQCARSERPRLQPFDATTEQNLFGLALTIPSEDGNMEMTLHKEVTRDQNPEAPALL